MRTGLRPGNGFEQFIEGAEATGQGYIAIRKFVHFGFAPVHIGWNLHAG